MPNVEANGIRIEYEAFGDPDGSPIILIMGLVTQMIGWPDRFCEMLSAGGHRVIRFDNRDVGLSSKMAHLGAPDVYKTVADHRAGVPVAAPYLLADMAADTIGLMDALGIGAAHVCGLSMGGMIAQLVASHYPARTISLISMESSTGEADLPGPTPEAMEAMVSLPPVSRQAYIDYMGWVCRAFAHGSSRYDEALQKILSARAYDRAFYPIAFTRQMTAIIASGGRRRLLGSVTSPALVIHGTADALLPIEHGYDTATSIAGATLCAIAGLGHGMAYPRLWAEIVDVIVRHTAAAEAIPDPDN
jgi:pimeloyl-ACP methyl ester carboxylesterase